jgi:probable phosphomutase (TIGR03848 family)
VATVVLLRHGRTTANAEGTLAGRGPVELDAHGRAQATALHARLTCGPPLAAVVTSPLIRCRQTLDLALPGTSLATEDDLIECGYGRWTGQRLSALATQPLWRAVQDHPAAAGFPDGESLAAMSARAVAAVRRWDQTVTANFGPDAVWLACSHGDIIKAVVADALGLHLDLFQRIVVDPASLTVIRYTPLRAFLMTLNDTGAGLRALRCRPGGSDAAVGGGRGCDDS